MGYERKWIDDSDDPMPMTPFGCVILVALMAVLVAGFVIVARSC